MPAAATLPAAPNAARPAPSAETCAVPAPPADRSEASGTLPDAGETRPDAGETRGWLWPGLAGAASLAALSPMLYGLGERMWGEEHRQFFPLVLVGAAFLVWTKLKPSGAGAAPVGTPRTWLAVPLWAVAFLTVATAVVTGGDWLGGAALLIVLPAWVYSLGGASLVRRLSGVWLFLLLALPLPLGYDGILVRGLQRAASDAAGGVLDLFGYVYVPRGVTLSVAGYDRPFFVDEACSGVNSLFSSFCCVGFYLVWVGRGLVRSAVILAATVGWVLVANAARVLAIVLGTVELGGADWAWGGVDLSLNADGWAHQLLGFASFAAALGLVVSTDRLLAFLVPRAELAAVEGLGGEPAAAGRTGSLASRLRPVPTPVWAGAAVAMGLLAGLWVLLPARVTISQSVAGDLGELRPIPEDALPTEWNGWQRVRYEKRERSDSDPLGRFSRIWWYARGSRVALISVDGPFSEWHDLAYCYRGQGWECEDVTDVRYADAFGNPADGPGAAPADASALEADEAMTPGPDARGGFTEMVLEDDAGNRGVVLFAGYDDRHAGIDPVMQRVDVNRRLLNFNRVMARLSGGDADADVGTDIGRTYQVQLLHTSLIDLDEAAKEDLRGLFHEMRRRLVRHSRAAGAADDAVAAH